MRTLSAAAAALLAFSSLGLLIAPAKAAFAAPLEIGKKPPLVTLQGEQGGRLDGTPWSSEMLTGKVWIVFYVDPDEREANEHVEKALKAAKLPKDGFASVGIINMAATWIPNKLIASGLAEKQKEYPSVIYVKDMKKVLVKDWGLKDDAYVTLLFDKEGKLLYRRDGTLSSAETTTLIETIRKNL